MIAKLKISVAGLGRAFSLMVAPFTQDPRVQLVGGADPRPEARSKFEADFSAPAFDSVAELAAHPGIDVVYVATPHQFHAEHVAIAARGLGLESSRPMLSWFRRVA